MIIGILPTVNLEDDIDGYYKFIDLYSRRIYECGATPIGILLNNGEIDYKTLDMCDAFVLQGGKAVKKHIYETIYYAIKNNKPLLGICLGSQAIAIFSSIYEKMDKAKEYKMEEVIEIYQNLKIDYDGSLLRLLEEGNMHTLKDGTNDEIKNHYHSIDIVKDTILYDVFKTDKLDVISLHSYDYKHVGEGFKVSAYAGDGVKEAIEYDNKDYFILGVHFHPEIMGDNRLFERLIKEAENRK